MLSSQVTGSFVECHEFVCAAEDFFLGALAFGDVLSENHDTADAFINTISSVLDDREQATRLGNAARDFVVSHFDWEVNMLKLQKLALNERIEDYTNRIRP